MGNSVFERKWANYEVDGKNHVVPAIRYPGDERWHVVPWHWLTLACPCDPTLEGNIVIHDENDARWPK